MVGTGQTRLAHELERVAGLCTETLAELADRYPAVKRTPFANEVRLAVAAMETTVQQLGDATPAARQSSLQITVTLARQAAEAARRHGIDEAMLRVASSCEAVAALCETALAAP
jgi:hypothetical protein